MGFAPVTIRDNVAIVTMNRAKVHAINAEALADLRSCFTNLGAEPGITAVILTGTDKFFSFGFDVPELLTYSRDEFKHFLMDFNHLLTDLFLFPKPLVGAINGHATAGGCMLALTTDYRIMVEEKARISLNEINIGASVFAGSVEMLRFSVGSRKAELVLTSGQMYEPKEAVAMGLIDKLSAPDQIMTDAMETAAAYAGKNAEAFRSMKHLLRKPVTNSYLDREEASVDEFIDIWLSEESQAQLRQVQIRQ